MNKHKEFIKKAYNGKLGLTMCSEWKELIENKYPEFKTKLEVGKWYIYNGCILNYQGENKEGVIQAYGIVKSGLWFDKSNFGDTPKEWNLANEEEVFEALKNEAIKRGFKKGVRFKTIINGHIRTFKGTPCFHEKMGFNLYGSNYDGCIFHNGKWAEIVETITKAEAEKQLGKTII